MNAVVLENPVRRKRRGGSVKRRGRAGVGLGAVRRRKRRSISAWSGQKRRHSTASKKGWRKRRRSSISLAAPRKRRYVRRRRSVAMGLDLVTPQRRRSIRRYRRTGMGDPGALVPAKGVVTQTIFAMGGVLVASKGGALIQKLCGSRVFGRRGRQGGLTSALFSYGATVLGTFVLDKTKMDRPSVDAFQVGGLAYVGLSLVKSLFGKSLGFRGFGDYEELGNDNEDEGIFGLGADEEEGEDLSLASSIGDEEDESDLGLGEYESLMQQ